MGIWVVSLLPVPAYPGRTDSSCKILRIRSLVDPGRQRLPRPSSSSIPQNQYRGLYLNIFRGEPAISRFDRYITSNHKSSHVISPTTGSGLFPILIGIHPVHG